MTKPKVIYRDIDHTYWMGDKRLTSVSRTIGKFKNPYDKEYWSYNTAFKRLIPDFKELKREILESLGRWKYPDYIKPGAEWFFPILEDFIGDMEIIKETQQIVLKEWKDKNDNANIKGTQFHLDREEESIKRGYEINPFDGKEYPVINPPKEYDNQSIVENLYDLEEGYYPELLIWDEELGMAGQADKVWIKKGRKYKYYYGDDYKTNEEKPKKSGGMDKMLPPLSHLKDNKYVHYNLQSTLYAGMMYRAGFKIGGTQISWYKDYDVNQCTVIPYKFLWKEFCSMMDI